MIRVIERAPKIIETRKEREAYYRLNFESYLMKFTNPIQQQLGLLMAKKANNPVTTPNAPTTIIK